MKLIDCPICTETIQHPTGAGHPRHTCGKVECRRIWMRVRRAVLAVEKVAA